jgi:site-specific DNA recombinase
MIAAAIYCRKSTAQPGVADEEKSIARQLDHARAYAAKKGWRIDEAHLYIDDAVSGAEWKNRHAFNRLLAALDPVPPFTALIVSEQARIGRDSVRVPYFLQQIEDAGVEVWGYLTDSRITLTDEAGEMRANVAGHVDGSQRRGASRNTRDALSRKAAAGYSTGGRCYGYRNQDVFATAADGRLKRQHVTRAIDPGEAEIVRRIFRDYSAGRGFKLIASALNHDGIPGPRGAVGSWRVSGVREMLHRELYHGVSVWGQTRKVSRRGSAKFQQPRPESEWQRIDVPDLRIIDEALWGQVQARLDKTRQVLTRATRGRLLSRPSYLDGPSAYLLTGFTRCKPCGGTIGSIPRMHGSPGARHRVDFYGCFANHRGGHAACGNNLHERQAILNRAILDAIAEKLDDKILTTAVELALPRILAQTASRGERRGALEQERATLERRIQRGLVAYLDGDGLADELRAHVRADKARMATIDADLATLRASPPPALNADRLRATLRGYGADVRGLLDGHVAQARQMLRKLLDGTVLLLEPVVMSGVRRYAFTGSGNYLRLLPPDLARTVVAPTGFEPVFQP